MSRDGADAGERKARKSAGKRRQPLKATPEGLERSALYYLERYDSSSGHLRRLLRRKILLSARVHGTDPEEGAAAVERLIARLTGLGLLDDARYARERVRGLLARGTSAAMIRAKLRGKSLPAALIEAALESEDCAGEGRELRAALRYAKRRRLGPFRVEKRPGERAERRDRDLAALGRQGFDYETARRVVDSEDPAALEAELDAG
ncbi:regulatory protein RecX [Pelagibius sp. CAU 1746]|uniref:regulatory protein RecX n=1 Tax=Pelagibius sp. CAU 1746 TaxID=3140370 RepID=UPI00325B47B0